MSNEVRVINGYALGFKIAAGFAVFSLVVAVIIAITYLIVGKSSFTVVVPNPTGIKIPIPSRAQAQKAAAAANANASTRMMTGLRKLI